MNPKKILVRILLFSIILLLSQSIFAQVTPATMQQIQLLLKEKKARTPAQQKIDSRLLQAVREHRGEKMVEGVDLEPANVNADGNGMLKVDIKADITDAFLAKIKALGGEIIYPSVPYHTVRAAVSLNAVETIAGYPEVKFIEPAVQSMVVDESMNKVMTADRVARVRAQLTAYLQKQGEDIGSVTSQGDAAHGAASARSTYGYLGAGIKVGVLSDSYNSTGGAAADVASGDLPGTGNPQGYTTPVTVVQDISGGSDEGRAMLQVIHDLAPAALLYFATADVSEAGFATNIIALRNTYGCNIIIDDVGYFDEAVFQDGTVAQAVDSVTNEGALYFSAAGNSGSLAKGTSGVFEGDFNSTGSGTFSGSSKAGTIHNFGTASSPVNGDIIKAVGEVYNLTWSDPYGASSNDYDLFYVNSSGTVKASSTNVQSGTQNPYEQISARTLSSGDRLVVFKTTAAAVRAFHLNTNRGTLTVATNGQTSGHPCAANAFCMAATPAATAFESGYPTGPYPGLFVSTDKVEPFSSDGPRRVFYNSKGAAITAGNFLFGTSGGTLLSKPDLTAADGVSTTLGSSTGLNPFFGTSCAGPHAGAIAALVLSANPSLTTTQMRTILTSTALDIEGSGYDINSGYGIVQAIQAVASVVTATPTITVTSALSPTSVTTTYGTASSNMTFSISGTNMTAGILVTPPAGFEVSLTSGGTYTATVTVGAAGTIASTPVYVRLKATDAVSSYSGNIALTSTGATTVNAAISSSTVSAAALTITANNGGKIYGQVFTTGAGSANFATSGLKNSETVGSITIASTGAAANAAVGGYSIVPSAATGGTFTASNYSITYTNGTLAVGTAALTIAANSGNKTYGQVFAIGAGSTAFTSTGLQNGETIGSISIGSNGAPANAAVGSYSIVPSTATGGTFTASNYGITYTNGTLTVGAATLTITANSTSKTYGSTVTFAGTEFTTTGLVNSDGVSSVTLTSGGAAASATAGSYSIVPSTATGIGLSNYSISYVNGTLTVNTATLTITANSTSKTYGSTVTFAGTEFTTTGLVNSDAVSSVTLTSGGAAASATAGGYSIVPSTATGSGLSNYSISYVNGTLTVNTATLTITANSTSKTYGSTVTFAGTEFTTTGLVNSDGVSSVTLTSGGAAASATAGSYSIVPSAGTGIGLSNYSISYVNGTLTVNTATLTITANSTSKTYGSTVTFAGTEFTTTGLVNSDAVSSVTLTSGGAAASATAGGYSIVPSTATGSGLSNYSISYVNGTLTVNTATLTITANSTSKTYGSTVTFAGTEFTTTGLVNSDAVSSITLTSGGAAASATAGGYSIVPSAGTGSGLSNYSISYVNGTLTVNTATLTITANSTSKTYGSTVTFAGTEFTATGLVNSDTVSGASISSAGAIASATVGSYAISISTATGAGLSNYSISYVNGVLSANAATLSITANNITKCNGATQSFAGTEFTTSGLVNGDLVSSVSLSSAGSTAAAPAGSYPIMVSSASGSGLSNYIISYINGTFTVEAAVVITVIQTNPDCYGNPGSLSSTIAGGIAPYTYKVNTGLTYNSSGSFFSNPLFTPLSAGYYTYAAEDANGCLGTAPGLTIAALTPTVILINNNSAPSTVQICKGGSVTISTTPVGGATPYTYSLNGGSFVSNANKFFNVPAGAYAITVKDNVGCTYNTNTVTVSQPSTALALSSSVTNLSCIVPTGTITITATGGYSSYTYSDNNGSNFQSGNSFTGLAAGTYNLVVKDANGCTVTGTATVKAPTLAAAAISGNLDACFGANTTISTSGSGGVSPYTYSLDASNNFVSSANRYFSVGVGSHTITVMDAQGCTATTAPVTVIQPSAKTTFTSTMGGAGCTSNGTITVTAAGGYGGYSYSSNGGSSYQSSSILTGLAYGSYSVAVKDQNGCAATTATVKLTALSSSAVQGMLTVCSGGKTTLSIVPSGGITPYTYSLDGGAFVPSANRYFSVGAGTHTITAKDSAGCTYAPPSVTVTTVNCISGIGNNDDNTATTVVKSVSVFNASAYPNPSSSMFNVQLKSSSREDVELIVTNIMGVKVYEAKGTIDQAYQFGASLPTGIYILQVRQGNEIHTIKLVKGN